MSMRHHMVQEKGRTEILMDYHLRVGQITRDTRVPTGCRLQERRLDETEVGAGTTLSLVDAKHPANSKKDSASELAAYLGLPARGEGLLASDVFRRCTHAGRSPLAHLAEERTERAGIRTVAPVPDGGRVRRVRVVRDYGMFDRREAPQYYPDAPKASA
jgi:hypothetical protein